MPLTCTDSTDDPLFIAQVDQLVGSAAARSQPKELRVFRIENWFHYKWLNFCCKYMGALGIWNGRTPVVPPFVQNRLTARSLFRRDETTPGYHYLGDGEEIHHKGSSFQNERRYAKKVVPDAALFWFSSNSAINQRGSVMAYIPLTDATHWNFYLGFENAAHWKPAKLVNIHQNELTLLQSWSGQPITSPGGQAPFIPRITAPAPPGPHNNTRNAFAALNESPLTPQ